MKRYAFKELNVRERFLHFNRFETTSVEALENLVRKVISNLGLSAESFLVGQGYDGGSNMSGELKGLAAGIRKSVPRALYIHCHSHRLNLALENALSTITETGNCLCTVHLFTHS